MLSPSNSSRPCLLIVDDTAANIDILVGLLKADFKLKIATRGAAALQICATTDNIDLILLDIMMPEMDGYEVCQKLRADPRTHSIPIIFLSAKTEVDDVVHGFEIGANDYVTKPFRPAELLARVRTHLTVQSQQREIAEKNTELTEMLHILCHDVANQFAVASLSLELMQMHPEDGMERVLPCLVTAVKNGIGLTNLVREIRRSEDKTLQLSATPLGAAIAEALLLVKDRREAKQLTVECMVPGVSVWAEPSALINSVFCNLLTNAVKFSHVGAHIEVSGQVHGDRVGITFRDHGIGMPDAVRATLFDVSKSHSRLGTAGERGTGFGMPLMWKFVAQFGGTIEVASRDISEHPKDHGTDFTIWLKLANSAGPEAKNQ